MPGFTPHCPRCDSTDTVKVGAHDRYADGASPVTSPPTSTVFAYKCECGLAFTFEVQHGQKPKSRETGLREEEAKPSGYQLDGDASV